MDEESFDVFNRRVKNKERHIVFMRKPTSDVIKVFQYAKSARMLMIHTEETDGADKKPM